MLGDWDTLYGACQRRTYLSVICLNQKFVFLCEILPRFVSLTGGFLKFSLLQILSNQTQLERVKKFHVGII